MRRNERWELCDVTVWYACENSPDYGIMDKKLAHWKGEREAELKAALLHEEFEFKSDITEKERDLAEKRDVVLAHVKDAGATAERARCMAKAAHRKVGDPCPEDAKSAAL